MNVRTRKLAGMIMLVVGISVYAVVAASLIGSLHQLPMPVLMLLYAVAGIAWIFAARPVVVWMETGQWWVRRER